MGNEDGGLGYCGNELAGKLIAGNDFNYVMTHAEAIRDAGNYNIVSCSSEALEAIKLKPSTYAMLDLVLGLERDDGHSLIYYKTFNMNLQQDLQKYTSHGGALMVSGAYVGSDMMGESEQRFLANVLKCRFAGQSLCSDNQVNGLGTTLQYWKQLNGQHYAAVSTDILQPEAPAFTAMQYADGQDAAIAYKGNDYRSFTMGFPFECIQGEKTRNSIMRGIINYLLK